MPYIAKEVCDMLRHMKKVAENEGNENIVIGHLAYGKTIMHELLLSHGFTLIGAAPFNALDDTVLELKFKSCYRNYFDYQVDFKAGHGFVNISFTRELTDPSVDPITQQVQNSAISVCTTINVKPTLENESRIQDHYMTEKILINITKTFSKLWTSF